MKNILDISVWNDRMTPAVYDYIAKNYEGVIMRVGYTGYGKPAKNKVADDLFTKHYEELNKRGVKLGGYWYGTDESPAEATFAAKKMLELIGNRKFVLGLFYDTEDSYYQTNMGKDLLTDTVLAFTNHLKKNVTFPVGVYASSSWFKNKLHFEKLGGLVIWEANYGINSDGKSSDVWYDSHLHQYTSNHMIMGSRYDSNIVRKAYWLEENEVVDKPNEPDIKLNKAIIKKGARARSKSTDYDGVLINSAYTGVQLDYKLNMVAGTDWVYFPSIQTYVDKSNVSFTNELNVTGKAKIKSGARARSKSSMYDGITIASHVIGVAMDYKLNQVQGTDWVYFPGIQTYVDKKDVEFL